MTGVCVSLQVILAIQTMGIYTKPSYTQRHAGVKETKHVWPNMSKWGWCQERLFSKMTISSWSIQVMEHFYNKTKAVSWFKVMSISKCDFLMDYIFIQVMAD